MHTKTNNTQTTEALVKIIRAVYQPPTSGHLRDLIDACSDFLDEVEDREYQKSKRLYDAIMNA